LTFQGQDENIKIILAAESAELFPGYDEVSAVLTGIEGTIVPKTGATSLSVDGLDLSIGPQTENILVIEANLESCRKTRI